MSKLNKSLISELQSKNLKETINSKLNGSDLNYLGFDRTQPKSALVKYGTDANVNRVLFWLSSKRNDYIREDFKGGVLYDLLGQLANDVNLQDWENFVRNKFNEEFSNDLTLMILKLNVDKKNRKIIINMVVQDRLKNITFPVSTEARA